MRASLLPVLLGLLPVFAALPSACTGQSSAAPPADDAGSSSGGDGSATVFVYTPKGCSYSYSPPGRLGFQNVGADDTGAVTATGGAPTRVRLGLGGGVHKGSANYADPSTSAAFTWETTEANHAAKVRYGTSMTSMTSVQAGYAWTTPGSIGPAVNMHEVHVCGLQPDTRYYYQVGGGPSGSEVWSATQDFMTAPASGAPVTVGVFGDARDVVGVWQLVHARMKEQAVSMMLVPGDVVDIGADETLYQQWLDAIWKDPTKPGQFLTLGQQMIVPINGNHENDSADSFANWSIPAESGDPYAETYASFDVGSVHFVLVDDGQISAISSGTSNPEATAQLAWLDADLKAADADRAKHPFIVALSHRGMFSTSDHAVDSDVLNTRAALAPLYDKYKVDLAINGHDHEYERSKPLHAGNPPHGAPVVGTGTQYIINAGAGANPYAINSSPQPYSSGKQVTFCGGGKACSSSPYIGIYSFLEATATSLKVTAYGLATSSTSISEDTVIDTVMLTPQ